MTAAEFVDNGRCLRPGLWTAPSSLRRLRAAGFSRNCRTMLLSCTSPYLISTGWRRRQSHGWFVSGICARARQKESQRDSFRTRRTSSACQRMETTAFTCGHEGASRVRLAPASIPRSMGTDANCLSVDVSAEGLTRGDRVTPAGRSGCGLLRRTRSAPKLPHSAGVLLVGFLPGGASARVRSTQRASCECGT